jgi:HAD superfamily hydrolase (TIGR01549 family)
VSTDQERKGQLLQGVLFDYGGTLAEFERPDAALAAADDRIVALLVDAGFPKLAAATLRASVLDRVDRDVMEHLRGGALEEMDVPAASKQAYHEAGIDLDDDLLLDEVLRIEQEAWWHGARVAPGAVALLDALREQEIRVGLCSNAPYRIRSLHGQLAFVGLATHLDAVTFSVEVGWRKPSPRMFAAALDALGTRAGGTVMVGDSETHDIAGARMAGMRAVLVSRRDAPVSSAADAVIRELGELPGALRNMGLYCV